MVILRDILFTNSEILIYAGKILFEKHGSAATQKIIFNMKRKVVYC